jgi:hypothetical protein
MKTLLWVILGGIVAALWLCLKWWQAKQIYTRDLSDGGIQKLFDDNSK